MRTVSKLDTPERILCRPQQNKQIRRRRRPGQTTLSAGKRKGGSGFSGSQIAIFLSSSSEINDPAEKGTKKVVEGEKDAFLFLLNGESRRRNAICGDTFLHLSICTRHTNADIVSSFIVKTL